MVTIGSALAQEIVERTMKIIPFNVNVMDARGIILASGTPERIGDLHPGAQLALGKQVTVEIDSAAASYMHGAKAGINLPLTVRGEICGVVGITGIPGKVRHFAELVRITAEMILEQAQLIGELQKEKGYREEFVYQLVSKTGISNTSLNAWAARLGVNLGHARTMFVLEISDDNHRPDLVLTELHRIQTELYARWPNLLTAVISPGELAMLETFDASGSQQKKSALSRRRLLELDTIVRQSLNSSFTLAMGISLPGLDGAAASYESARQTARVGRSRSPESSIFSYYDLSLPVLLSGLGTGWQAEQLRQSLRVFSTIDNRTGLLLRTLAMWFKHNSQLKKTADALHIHRNTLDYRLRKIGELTGLDLESTDDRVLLYVALQLQDDDPH